ncbi:hypothetical protein XENOCAPTIV_003997 [Xenoophorus captivus]|uniref:Uncharacterized protein n=1 Tax=Xenoophorus captivus TaxID=1517983 RepID=A0ABV0RBP8_9TELE
MQSVTTVYVWIEKLLTAALYVIFKISEMTSVFSQRGNGIVFIDVSRTSVTLHLPFPGYTLGKSSYMTWSSAVHLDCDMSPSGYEVGPDLIGIIIFVVQTQFLCLKNIRTFLVACSNSFGMKKSELFDAFDLFDVRNFGKILKEWSLSFPMMSNLWKSKKNRRRCDHLNVCTRQTTFLRNQP